MHVSSSVLVIVTLVVVAAAGALWRRRVAARFERRVAARHPVAANGIIPGAEPIIHDVAAAPAVLLVHGGGDTPQTLRYLADDLIAHGFAVHAPLLPGHGRALRDFAHVSAESLLEHARREYESMSREYAWVAIVGLSMGGAIAVRLAAETPPPALVLLSPYLAMPPRIKLAARLAWLWGLFVPYVDATPDAIPSVLDEFEANRSLAYGVFSARALRALYDTMRRAAAALPRLRAPTLMIQSRTDGRIAPEAAAHAFERIGAPEKRIIWMTDIGHVITVDRGREAVFTATRAWLDQHGAEKSGGAHGAPRHSLH